MEISLLGQPALRRRRGDRLIGRRIRCADRTRAVPGWRALRVAPARFSRSGGGAVAPQQGARAYLAIAGGFQAATVLDSAAADVNAQIGPLQGRPLRAGDELPIGRASSTRSREFQPTWSLIRAHGSIRSFASDPPDPAAAISMRSMRRPRAALFAAEFRVTADSNRVGFRLDGARLALAAPARDRQRAGRSSAPCNCRRGGQPIALMAEHPTTGGYPRIGQVAAIDLPRLAQRRPGDPVRFREIGLDEAQTRYLRREHELARLLDAIATRLAGHD